MQVYDVLIAFSVLSLLLLIALVLRQRVRVLRQLGLPEALIAGLLGLAVGPYGPLQLVPDRVQEVWSQAPAALIALVFATLFLGQRLPSPQRLWERAAHQTAFSMVIGFGQYLVAGVVVLLVLQPLLGSHPLMATLVEVGFEGGHGTAAGLGRTYTELGFPAGRTLALAMATVGVMASVLLGTALVLVGQARTWLLRQRHRSPSALVGGRKGSFGAEGRLAGERAAGLIPAEQTISLDVLTLNLCLAGVAVGVGALLKQILIQISPLFDAVPVFPLAMVGGLLVQLLLQKLNQPFLASASDQASIASLSMDVLITAAMASLNLPLLADNLLPFTVLAVVGLVWNVLMVLLLAPRLFPDAWFERAIADFGQATGSTANGLLLLRMADPTGRSQVLEAFSFKQLLFEPFLGGGLITAFAPLAITSMGLGRWTALCLAFTLCALVVGLRLLPRSQAVDGSA
ncbi:sodium:solute symporter [Cyanobium sp. ATX 6A2]|uniref:sodium/glutamate symporter n=1 Tax=Cyanobium sp. ATX 6A2 TaxID=2823700 RepID=UPI0020CC0169|nr:sodium/glutamate symporter [Cyanobium sp. ATX 6A2]MCP9887450.1 sodium:solute symporter [Cyanobium sp. ATX 6A2]